MLQYSPRLAPLLRAVFVLLALLSPFTFLRNRASAASSSSSSYTFGPLYYGRPSIQLGTTPGAEEKVPRSPRRSTAAATSRRTSQLQQHHHHQGLDFLLSNSDDDDVFDVTATQPCRSIGETLLRGAFLRVASDMSGGTPLENIKTRGGCEKSICFGLCLAVLLME